MKLAGILNRQFLLMSNDKRVAQEEIFGPVLVIIPFEDEAEAIKIANDTPYGLAAYMQTGSKAVSYTHLTLPTNREV